ncbi:MAG: carcinine hydrolase/isopenicillin-N N-acyltransferase family protein [Nitrososphaerales archaeon]
MCTIFAMLRPNSKDRLLFLENHDKVDVVYLGEDVRLIDENKVVALFDYRSKGIVCGYSLKTKIFGGVANVPGFKGSMSRGVLLKEVLSGSKDLDDAISMIKDKLRSGLYSSANYVLGDLERIFRIENFDGKLYISKANSVIVTNRFHHIDFKPEKDLHQRIIENSLRRENYIQSYMQKGELTIKDIFRIAKHHGERDSICRHGGFDTLTLSSVIFHLENDLQPKILYIIGNPCENQYNEFKF